MKNVYSFLDKHIAIIVTIILFLLISILAFFWEYKIILYWEDWKYKMMLYLGCTGYEIPIKINNLNLRHAIIMRVVATICEILLAGKYLQLRKNLRKIFHAKTKSRRMKLFWADTSALCAIFVPLYIIRFYAFNAIDWINSSSLQFGIWSTIILSVACGRLMGYTLDRTEKYIRVHSSKRIKTKLKKYNWCNHHMSYVSVRHFFVNGYLLPSIQSNNLSLIYNLTSHQFNQSLLRKSWWKF